MVTYLTIEIKLNKPMRCARCGNWYTCIINSFEVDVGEELKWGVANIPRAFLNTLVECLETEMFPTPKREVDMYG